MRVIALLGLLVVFVVLVPLLADTDTHRTKAPPPPDEPELDGLI